MANKVIVKEKYANEIDSAVEKYRALLESQLERVERINSSKETVDYKSLDKIVIGVCGGDGIGHQGHIRLQNPACQNI